MVSFQNKASFVAALVISVVIGAGVGYALQPSGAPSTTDGAGGHEMTPAEQCQHMPEMCPTPGGNQTARR
ncbi:MAG: hypothetical protein WDA16_00455 [Candidatus Thermoplasmatota archaeon]